VARSALEVPPVAEIAIELNAQKSTTAKTRITSARIVQANIFDASSALTWSMTGTVSRH
jgi:NADH:ubiquinone oxidoreductase subunit D